MTNGFNLTAIYLTNIIAVSLLVLLLSGNYWKVNKYKEETAYLRYLMMSIIVAAIADAFAFTLDGKPGVIMGDLEYLFSLLPYLMDVVEGYCWVMFLVKHLNGKIHGVHVRGLISLSVIAAAIMVVNFFYPIIFYVDEANHYVRGPLFLMSIGINMLFFVDSMIIYFVIRKKSGALAFFPIWQFIIPIIVAIFFQTIFYGVSLLWAGAAVAMVGVVSSLQNELIYVDKLTGLYNRFYLDDLKEKIAKKRESEYTIMMLDLNGFKQINDNYGHSVGDEALRHAGKIMQEVVGSKGTVMRYAGDEFVIVLNTHDLAEAEKYARGIHDGFAEFNVVSNKPYKLFTSVGYCVVDFRNSTVEAMMNMVDKLMYKDKSTFYADHPEFERRLR